MSSQALEAGFSLRNGVEGWLYRHVAKPVFFRRDPEWVHNHIVVLGAALGSNSVTRSLTHLLFHYRHPALAQDLLGIHFANPVGLSAGFDKEGTLVDILPDVGFGFMELGSVTAKPYAGNEGVRLARVPELKSLVVNYGLKSEGCQAVAARLKGKKRRFPLGISLAPTNVAANADPEKAVADYLASYRALAPLASYITLNVSCPNTCNSQPFLLPENLEQLLAAVDKEKIRRPIFLKLSPDLSLETVDALLAVANCHRMEGVICTNLVKQRTTELQEKVAAKGGLSGKVVEKAANELIAHIYSRYPRRFVIIGCGGVFSAEDAYKKIRLGASLIHMITGMIYEGPQVISEINRGLVRLLQRDGFTELQQAVGADFRPR